MQRKLWGWGETRGTKSNKNGAWVDWMGRRKRQLQGLSPAFGRAKAVPWGPALPDSRLEKGASVGIWVMKGDPKRSLPRPAPPQWKQRGALAAIPSMGELMRMTRPMGDEVRMPRGCPFTSRFGFLSR